MRAHRLLFASLPALAWAQAAAAQPPGEPTTITPDAAPPLSLGTTATRVGNVTTIDGGTRAGPNLFHSFSRFDLGQGDVARWVHSGGNPATIANVVNRVTGGDPSNIDGEIDSTALPNADFWFINPAGVIFGQGARLDVPAAAHFTTAQALHFAAGPSFTVATPGGSTFSVAAPAAFGFFGGQGAVSVNGVGPAFLPGAGRLTLTGSDVSIAGSSFAGSGFGIAAVGSGLATLNTAAPRASSGGGTAAIVGSVLRSTGNDGLLLSGDLVDVRNSDLGTAFSAGPIAGISGPIDIFGREVTIFGSLISASTFGAEDAGDIRIAGERVTISGASMVVSETRRFSTGAAGSILIAGDLIEVLDDSRISSSTLSAARGGDIGLFGDRIVIDRSTIAADVRADATGSAGSVDIAGGVLELIDGSSITSQSDGFGNAGSIVVDMSERVSLDLSNISSDAQGQGGASGMVSISAPVVDLHRSRISSSTETDRDAGIVGIRSDAISLTGGSVIQSRAERGSSGDAGLLLILSPTGNGRLLLTGGSALRSDTLGSGDAGGILIATGAVELREGGIISSDAGFGCTETVCGPIGSAGGIAIFADRLLMVDGDFLGDGTRISSDSFGAGSSGSIEIRVGDLTMQGFADISSDTFVSGRGGALSVFADTIALSGPATISTSTFGSGAGGSLRLDASQRISIGSGARILSTSGDGRTGPGDPENPITGPGGSITLLAPTIEIVDGTVTTSSFTSGNAGNIIVSGDRLLLDNFSLLTTATFGPGSGGSIIIDVGELSLRGGSVIDADSFCPFDGCASSGGDAGDITITADRVDLAGFDDADFGPVRSGISSNTQTNGRAGDISIRAGQLILSQADIGSQTGGRGDAGTITLDVGTLILTDTAAINTNSAPCPPNCDPWFDAGDAGDIAILARDIAVSGNSIITSSTSGSGDAGLIGIAADGRIQLDRGHITTVVQEGSTGRSGIIAIGAGELVLLDGSIRTNSNSASEAGGILIEAPRVTLVGEDSAISSANGFDGVGGAGAIFMTTEQLALLGGARLSTASLNGAAGTIEIFMPDTGLLVLQSQGTPSLITTSSGPGTGGRIFIARPLAIITNGGQILALGQEGGANVQIATDFFIRSADRFNRVAVDGAFLLEATVGDISSGTVNRDLSVIDASGVLRGQCASARASGQVSQLVVRPIGPYGDRSALPPPGTGNQPTGGCF